MIHIYKSHPFRKACLASAVCLALAGCESSLSDVSSYDVAGACREVPDRTINEPQPVYTNDAVVDIFDLAEVISFDNAERITGTIPIPGANGALNFSDIVVTDKSIQSVFIIPGTGAVSDSQRIGAVFIQIDGINEYFAIPISLEDAAAAQRSLLPLSVTLRGPFPIEGTDPEPDIIQSQIISNITVAAFLVGINEEAPDVTTTFDGISDTANWIAPAGTPKITAENVGTGGITATLFWNTATDIDLWIIEPDGHKIFWNDINSTTGDGYLDFDDRDGFGPENIYFTDDIAEGTYQVQVNYFSGSPVTNWSVSLNACGTTRAFSGTLNNASETDNVYSFVYGPDCSIEAPPPETDDPTLFEEVVLCDPATLDSLTE